MTRVQIEIFIGTVLILATSLIVLIYGIYEEGRMAEYELDQHARAIEEGAALFESQCSRCHGTQGLGIPGLCPPLNDRYFFDQRLQDINWSGTMEDYIVATASSGLIPHSSFQEVFQLCHLFSVLWRPPEGRAQHCPHSSEQEPTATLVEVPEVPVETVAPYQLPEGDMARGRL
jgi:hypothetical protein